MAEDSHLRDTADWRLNASTITNSNNTASNSNYARRVAVAACLVALVLLVHVHLRQPRGVALLVAMGAAPAKGASGAGKYVGFKSALQQQVCICGCASVCLGACVSTCLRMRVRVLVSVCLRVSLAASVSM